MSEGIQLLRQDEAHAVIVSTEDDRVLNLLMNNAFYHLIKIMAEEKKFPVCDLDACHLMELMKNIFSEKDIIRRILDGENVRWFDD